MEQSDLDTAVNSYLAVHRAVTEINKGTSKRIRWLGGVAVHVRPYGCDESQDTYHDETHDDNNDDGTTRGKNKGADKVGSANGGDGDAEISYGYALDALAKRRWLGDNVYDVPVPRSSDLRPVTNGPLAAASLALRDLVTERPFTCGGRLDLSALSVPPEWNDSDGNLDEEAWVEADYILQIRETDAHVWHDAGTLGNPDLSVLNKHSVPSPFGDLRTGATVHDESVRVAREIPAERARLVLSPSMKEKSRARRKSHIGNRVDDAIPWARTSLCSRIMSRFASTLRSGAKCTPKLNKINIYGPGGFFSTHVDTPTSADMVGTVVVALPVAFTGGDLTVKHLGSTHVHSMSITPSDLCDAGPGTADGPRRIVSWAGLFGDCAHEVTPVESGHRITLAFDVQRKVKHAYSCFRDTVHEAEVAFSASAAPETAVSDAAHRLADAVDAYHGAARNGEKVQEDAYSDAAVPDRKEPREKKRKLLPLGIVLSHRYAGGAPTLERLKGADRIVAGTIAARYRCTLIPVVVRRTLQSAEYGYEMERSARVAAFTLLDIRFLANKGDESEDQGSRPAEALPVLREHAFLDMVAGRELHSEHTPSCEYTGNEACPNSDTGIYFSAALLIDGPL